MDQQSQHLTGGSKDVNSKKSRKGEGRSSQMESLKIQKKKD